MEKPLLHEPTTPSPTPSPLPLPSVGLLPSGGHAVGLVRAALLPESTVDFPQITEICERLEAVPSEAPEAVAVLVTVLRGNSRYRTKLKALTISNEMLYDERTIMAFKSEDGFREALATLRTVRNTGLGDTVDENIRMLATEVDKICFSEPNQGAPEDDGKLRKTTSASKSFGLAMRNNLRTVADTFTDAAGFSSKKLDRTQVQSAMSSTAKAVENRLERTGETLEKAAGFTASAFYKASARMMEGAERTLTNLRNEAGISPTGSPTAAKTSPASLRWIPNSSDPMQSSQADNARWQASQVTPAVASNARVPSSASTQGTRRKSDPDELQAAQEEQELQWALAQSLMDAQVNLCQSLAEPHRSEKSCGEERRGRRESTGGREAEESALTSLNEKLHEAEMRETRAQRALAEAQHRISNGRSEMRQLRSQIADSRNSMASLTERLYEADSDLQRVIARTAELERLFLAAKHSTEACLVVKTHHAADSKAASALTENLPDE